MPMYNLIKYSDNAQKLSGILFQLCRDVEDDGEITDFVKAKATTDSFKVKLTGQTGNDGTKKLKKWYY